MTRSCSGEGEADEGEDVDALLRELTKPVADRIDDLTLTDREREVLQKLVSYAMADRLREETFFRIKESIDRSRATNTPHEEHVVAYRGRVYACAEECERAIVAALKGSLREVDRG